MGWILGMDSVRPLRHSPLGPGMAMPGCDSWAVARLWAGLGPEDINLALSQPDLPAYRLSRGRVTAGEPDSMPEDENSGATQIAF